MCSTAPAPSRGRGATAAVRRHVVLPDVGGMRSGGAGAGCWRKSARSRPAGQQGRRESCRPTSRATSSIRRTAGRSRWCLRAPQGKSRERVSRRSGRRGFVGRRDSRDHRSHRGAVGIVTWRPKLDGGLDLVRQLAPPAIASRSATAGRRTRKRWRRSRPAVSHATHLFNRMSPMSHRAPGVPGRRAGVRARAGRAHLRRLSRSSRAVTLAVRAKGLGGIMAITDGTAGSGLACRLPRPPGRPADSS